MRIVRVIERNGDNAWLAGMGTIFGMLAAPQWLGQFIASIFTMLVGAVVLHFVKRELHHRYPPKKRTDEEEDD